MSEHEPRFVLIRGNATWEQPIPPKRCKPYLDAVNHRRRNRRIVRLIDFLVTVGVVGVVGVVGLCAYAVIGGWL